MVYLSGNPVVEDVKAKQQKEVIRFAGFLFSSFVDLDIHTKVAMRLLVAHF